jgi:hypothetical protein
MNFTSGPLAIRILTTLACVLLLAEVGRAQVPIETRVLKLQGATSGSILLRSSDVTTNYSIIYPNAQGAVGSLLYMASSDGTMAWTSAPGGDHFIPLWDISANSGAGGVLWTDPASAQNPMWSISGNNLAGPGMLGTTSAQPLRIITDGKQRIELAGNGDLTLNGTSQGGVSTIIGRAGHTTNIRGTLDVDAATSIDGVVSINTAASNSDATHINTLGTGIVVIGNSANELEVNAGVLDLNSTTMTLDASGTIAVNGTLAVNTVGTSVTSLGNTSGGVTIAGPMNVSGSFGTQGDVFVSQGAGSAPQWQGIASAVGIRKAGNLTVTNAVQSAAISAVGLAPTDAIIVTMQGSGSGVVATVTDRDDSNDTFRVTFSGSFSGTVNYMVLAAR